jgi:hypothetical protein
VRELIDGCGVHGTAGGEVLTTGPLRADLLHELTEAMAETAAAPSTARADTPGLGFADAMAAVLAGEHITRDRWAGRAYVTAQAGYPDGIGINANTAAATGLPEGEEAEFGPYLMKCQLREGERPRFVPGWAPNQGDMFATDWRVRARPGRQG